MQSKVILTKLRLSLPKLWTSKGILYRENTYTHTHKATHTHWLQKDAVSISMHFILISINKAQCQEHLQKSLALCKATENTYCPWWYPNLVDIVEKFQMPHWWVTRWIQLLGCFRLKQNLFCSTHAPRNLWKKIFFYSLYLAFATNENYQYNTVNSHWACNIIPLKLY
jgi:hypothetical protein